MTHGGHIYSKASDMAKSTICAYPQSDHALPQWKCVLWCCAKCPSINLPDQKSDDQYSDTRYSIRFHIYHIIACCTTHGRIMLNNRNIFFVFKQDSASEQSTKIYTRKELLMIETTISNSHKSLYIP